MKASILHLLSSPSSFGGGGGTASLKDRIVHSTAPLRHDNDNDDDLLLSGQGNGQNGQNGAKNNSNSDGHVGMSSNGNDGNGINSSIKNSSHNKSSFLDRSISIVEVHPTEPILCYVDYQYPHPHGKITDSDSNSNAGNSKGQHKKKKVRSPIHQRIILHNFIQNQIVSQISLLSIVQQWINSNDDHNSVTGFSGNTGNTGNTGNKKTAAEQQAILHQTCVNLGYISSIQFMDRQVLFYNSGKSHQDPSHDSYNSMPYLILKFAKGILIYHHNSYTNLNVNSSTSNTNTNMDTGMPSPSSSSSPLLPFPPVMDITQSKLNSSAPTSKPTPIASTNLLAIGCSDGAMRFFSLKERRVVKSVRGPNGRNDPVVGIVAVNSWSVKGARNGHDSSRMDGSMVRIATVCSSGNAYVWELQVEFNRIKVYSTSPSPSTSPSNNNVHITSTSPSRRNTGISHMPHLQSLKIRSPLVKLDLYHCTQHLFSKSSSSNSDAILSPSSNSSKSKWTKRDRFKVSFDPDHQLLYWTIQFGSSSSGTNSTSTPSISGGSGSAGGRTVVAIWEWNDLALFHATTSVNRERHKSEAGNETPIYRPSTILQIPTLEGHDVSPSLSNVLPGLVHPSFSERGIMNLVVSNDGNVHVVGAKRNSHVYDSSASTMSASASTLTTSSKSLAMEEAVVYHTFTLQALQKSARGEALSLLKLIDDGKVRVTSVAVSRSRPDWVILVTNVGILVLNLVLDEEMLLTGSHHVMFPLGRGNANGLVSVEGSSVFVSLVADQGSAGLGINMNAGHPSPTVPPSVVHGSSSLGKIWLKNKTLVYESPQPVHKFSVEFQSRPVRLPPRLLLSPSGKFLCLFWHYENRYEILHMGSLTDAIRKPNRDGNASGFSPAVDTGFDILSFAWVGNEDSFALLCPPELVKEDNAKIVKMRTTIDVLGTLNAKQDGEVDANVAHDPAKFKPRVELKVLVGVNADANEFSVSIAAATATFLGSISLRGRHAPTCLIGGPVLCVGSFMQDKDTAQRDGMSYFYCLRPNAVDDRASSYISVGPALPYPDLVVWDDEGGLCALVVGRRVAIYRSYAPNFTLVGTAYLGIKTDFEPVKVQSAKFLHGVLYCSTEKSIQCIFLGDLDKKEQVCETDSFILASIEPPIISTSLYSLRPTQVQMSLLWPSILGYHQGVLLVSSANGAQGVSLDQSLLRIGALLAAGQLAKAQKWIDSIHPSQHEYLANFLSRRGSADLAIHLSGVSIQTVVQLCTRYGFRGHLDTLGKRYHYDMKTLI